MDDKNEIYGQCQILGYILCTPESPSILLMEVHWYMVQWAHPFIGNWLNFSEIQVADLGHKSGSSHPTYLHCVDDACENCFENH